jgi:hypothetical protein
MDAAVVVSVDSGGLPEPITASRYLRVGGFA